MRFYRADPEVAGELGPKTVFTSQFPTRVAHMQYLFDAWPCDDIVQAYPCFGVSEALKRAIEAAELSGVAFRPAEAGGSDYLPSSTCVSPYWELLPVGVAVRDDFGALPDQRLVVSERGLATLEQFRTSVLDLIEITDANA